MSDDDEDTRTLQAWVNGEHFVFRGDEVDEAMRRGQEAADVGAAWEALAAYGREVSEE